MSNDDAFERNDGFPIIITYTSEEYAKDDWVIDGRILNGCKIYDIEKWRKLIYKIDPTARYLLISIFFAVLWFFCVIIFLPNSLFDKLLNLPLWTSELLIIIPPIPILILIFRFVPIRDVYKKPKWTK